MESAKPFLPNALSGETSPYLLQHAHNPVRWHPWGAGALELARREDKPILLSIGYSACHWCHVMAHESFEDEATAALMNEHFVNIKVDREERPDIDKIYQTAQHVLTQRTGGWPLTMFLTPEDHTPFFGGTYFPREARWGLPGFKDLLWRIAEFWATRRDVIRDQNAAVIAALDRAQPVAPAAEADLITPEPIEAARMEAAAQFDAEFGGFGAAPKFPHPTNIERLLRHYAASVAAGRPDDEARHMALFTLERMALGSMYDQIGGGFARYSVDRYWMIPHFEKMLYDNGLLLALYSEAWQIKRDPLFRKIATETAEWALRDMQSPEGGFYSSLDADSESHEGKFYVWTPEEIGKLLDAEELAVITPHFGFDRPANFEGKWHAYVYVTVQELARERGQPEQQIRAIIDRARDKLQAARSTRIWPGRDDKVLTSWNALLIKGLTKAGLVFEQPAWIAAAERALEFLRNTLWRDGRLLATFKDGRAHLNAYLDDYAFLLDAILTLLQARWRAADLAFAIDLAEVLLTQFEDPEMGGFYFTSHDHERLIQRTKSFADDAVPAGNGIAAHALARLGHLLGEIRYLDAAERTLRAGWSAIERYPIAYNSMLLALEEYLSPPQTIVLRGTGAPLAEWQAACVASYAPRRLALAIPDDATDLPGLLAQRAGGSGTIAYVCAGHHCEAPIRERAELDRALRRDEVPPAA